MASIFIFLSQGKHVLDLNGHHMTESYWSVLSVIIMIMLVPLDRTTQVWCICAHIHALVKIAIQCQSLKLAAWAGIVSMPIFLGMLIPGPAVHAFLLHACPSVCTDCRLPLWWTQIWSSLNLDTQSKSVDRVGAGGWASAMGTVAQGLVQRDTSQLTLPSYNPLWFPSRWAQGTHINLIFGGYSLWQKEGGRHGSGLSLVSR